MMAMMGGRKLLLFPLLLTSFLLSSVFLVPWCDAAATTKAPTPPSPPSTTTIAPNKCPASAGKTYMLASSAELPLPVVQAQEDKALRSVCIEFDYYLAGAASQPVDVFGTLELSYHSVPGNLTTKLTSLQLNTWRPLSEATLCLANYVAVDVGAKNYSLALKLISPKHFQDLCFSFRAIYQDLPSTSKMHATDFLLPFGDASNASTPNSALNELESMVPNETVDELWHSQWNDAYLQFEDYFELTSKSIHFSSSVNISSTAASSSSSSSSDSMTARLSTKWIHLTESLKKKQKNGKTSNSYLYRLSNGLLNDHHLTVYPVVCSDQGACFDLDFDGEEGPKRDQVSADVHFSLPDVLFQSSNPAVKLFRLEFVFEFSFQGEHSHSNAISVDLALLDAAHPCYYFNPVHQLITDRPGRCVHNGICEASLEVRPLNWKCLCPTDYSGARCEEADYCSQRQYPLPSGGNSNSNSKLLTGTEVCNATQSGSCLNRAFGFSCDCNGDSDFSWRPATRDCRLVPLCPKAEFRDECDSRTQVCQEPPEGSKEKKVTCVCAPGYEKDPSHPGTCRKPNPCSPDKSPCGLNADCLPVFNSMDDFKPDKASKAAICYCKKGYVKDKAASTSTKKLVCRKPDPCAVGGLLFPPCEQVCKPKGSGHECSCFSGYQSDPHHPSKCVIKSGVKQSCSPKCSAVGSWCDETAKKCKCKDGFDYTVGFIKEFKDPKTNKTHRAVDVCTVHNATLVKDAACPNGKLVNNAKTGVLECNCTGVFELDPKGRICKLKPICSTGAEGDKVCSGKQALCLLTDKANQMQASGSSSTTTPKTTTTTTLKPDEIVLHMSDLYTCSCKPGQHWSADKTKCIDLCADFNITNQCAQLNAVCNPLAALTTASNTTFDYQALKVKDWKSICLCQEGLVRQTNSSKCTLPQLSDPVSSYSVQLNFSKESYQLLYQFKAVTEQQLHKVHLSNGAFLSKAQRQMPPNNFMQLVSDYRSSVDANEDKVKRQVDGPLALLVGRQLLDLALNRLVEQYMGQLVAHSKVSITTRSCGNADTEGFVSCQVEIVVANEENAAKAIDGGDLVRFFKKQFSDNCIDDDDGDVCTIAIAGVKKEGQFFTDSLEGEESEDVEAGEAASLANVTEPISLILSKKSVDDAAFEQFDFCKNSKCPPYTKCKATGSAYECNCQYVDEYKKYSVYYADPTATKVTGYIAPVHACKEKKPTEICNHYAEKFANEHKTNISYFVCDDHRVSLNDSSPSAPLVTVKFNCSSEGYSVPTNASTEEVQDVFVHVKNYCVNKYQHFCGKYDCNGANGVCEVGRENRASCRCKDGWLGDRCQTKESFWYMIGLIIVGSLMLLFLIANTAWCIIHKRKKRSRSRPRHTNSIYLNRGDSSSKKSGGKGQRGLEAIELSHYEMNERGANSRGGGRSRIITKEEEEEQEYATHRTSRHRSRSRAAEKQEALKASKSAPTPTTKSNAGKKSATAGKSKSSAAHPPYTISSRRDTLSTSSDSSSTDCSSQLDLPPSRPPSLPPTPTISGGQREAAHSASSSGSSGGAGASSSSDRPVILTRSMLLGNGGSGGQSNNSSGSSIGNGGAPPASRPTTAFQYVPSNLRNRSTDATVDSEQRVAPRASGRASKSHPAYAVTNPAVSALAKATKELAAAKQSSSSGRTAPSSSRSRNYD